MNDHVCIVICWTAVALKHKKCLPKTSTWIGHAYNLRPQLSLPFLHLKIRLIIGDILYMVNDNIETDKIKSLCARNE